jgi:hypothetical protein
MSEPGGYVRNPGSGIFAGIAEAALGKDAVEKARQRAREQAEADLAQARWDRRWYLGGVLLKAVWTMIGLSTATGFDIVVWRAIFG